ncbi:MAG TPA: translocation/assembly module TamB domain-containing protein [bacterium]|nr:translocation/assembly module TamB domain-containing protein [bacterium]
MRSSFWRILAGILIALAAPIVVVLSLAVLILSVAPVGRYALSQALVRGGPRFGLDVRFGRVEGNIMRSITFDDLVLKLGPDSLRVKRLSLTYDPWASIVHRSFSASAASAFQPTVFVSSKRSEPPGPSSKNQYPPLRIGQFSLSEGSVYVDTAERLDSVSLTLNLVSAPVQMLMQVSDVKARLSRERVSVRNLAGSARLTSDSLVVTDLVAKTAASSLRADLRMALSSGGVAARVESLSVSLPELISAVPVGQKAGAATAGQRSAVQGRFRLAGGVGLEKNQPSANVRYEADGLVWQAIRLPAISGSLDLADSVVRLTMSGADSTLGSADVAGRLDLRRLDFSGSAKLTGVRVRRFGSSVPNVKVDAELAVSGRGFDSVAANVTASVPDLGVERLAASGTYLRSGQRASVEQFELSGPVGAVSGHGSWQNGRVEADVRMDSFNLGIVARLESLPLQGRVSGTVTLAGTADTIQSTSELSVSRLSVAGFSATRARADFTVAVGHELSGRLQAAVDSANYSGTAVDSVRLNWQDSQFSLGVWRPGLRAAADGSARLARDGIGINVAALHLVAGRESLAFSNIVQVSLQRDSLNVQVAAEGFAGGDVHATIAGAAGKPPRVDAAVNRLDLARLKGIFGIGLEMSGTVSLAVSGSDTFLLSLDADKLNVPDADVQLSKVEGKLRIGRTRTEIDHLWVVHLDSSAVSETSVVKGSIDYKTEGGFEPGAANLQARLRNPGAWVVFYLKPTIEFRQGGIYGDLTVKGNLMEPMFDGRVRISTARLGVPVLGTVFDRVNAELVFDHNRINVEKLSGRSDHGTVIVTGFVDIGRQWQADSLRFHGDFNGTTINPMPELYGVIGGSLDVDWTLGRPYSLSGTVNVQEALISFGFGQSAVTGVQDTLLVYDVRVKGDRNIWFRNQLADIELGCDLTVHQTTKDVLYSGELTSRQGTIYYLDHTLRVDSGSVTFNGIHTLNPDFNVEAEMPIPAAAGNQGLPNKITLALTGTLEQPSFAFSSDPPGWDESAIISYLTLSVTPGDASSFESRDAVTRLLSQRLLGYFQTQVAKRARGFVNLDYLEVESGLLTGTEARVTVGKYVGRNLYVSYTQNFEGNLAPSFRVEYYINRKNELVAEGTADSRYRNSLRYQLKLRY